MRDSFGVGANMKVSDNLNKLLVSNNVPLLSHYRLIGTQVDFRPSTLGNPLIEGPGFARTSCMGCHRYAALDAEGHWPEPDPTTLTGVVQLPDGKFSTDSIS